MLFHRSPMTSAQQADILAFVRRDLQGHRHVIDLCYRLCSPAAHVPENTAIWSRPDGEIVGFAIIQRQFWTIDYGTSISIHAEVFADILDWANQRMEAIAHEERTTYPDGIMNFFDCLEDDRQRQAELLAAGYREFASWSQVHRWQRLDRDLPSLAVPEGFVLRPLAGAEEVVACAALQRLAFDSTNMTADWRLRILRAEWYRPDLDLVLALPTGELVAFCLGWQTGDQGQIEPMGVHPDFRRQGFGRVILRSCLRQMQRRGVVRAHIEHDGAGGPAAQLYISEGFGHPKTVRKYMRRWHATV